ncbi:MAG: hypothetical protein H7A21_16650 [Spirochaetales bacterium]|nr:hypothetical protein [Leptospiraceae bacterium]MCP5483068.1 hypothetical protein [Spirochaetales bacterium]MCP5486124.1 hypothetical protein [Spirochaetales bacterium]
MSRRALVHALHVASFLPLFACALGCSVALREPGGAPICRVNDASRVVHASRDVDTLFVERQADLPAVARVEIREGTVFLIAESHTMPSEDPEIHRFDTTTFPPQWIDHAYWVVRTGTGTFYCRLDVWPAP